METERLEKLKLLLMLRDCGESVGITTARDRWYYCRVDDRSNDRLNVQYQRFPTFDGLEAFVYDLA